MRRGEIKKRERRAGRQSEKNGTTEEQQNTVGLYSMSEQYLGAWLHSQPSDGGKENSEVWIGVRDQESV